MLWYFFPFSKAILLDFLILFSWNSFIHNIIMLKIQRKIVIKLILKTNSSPSAKPNPQMNLWNFSTIFPKNPVNMNYD